MAFVCLTRMMGFSANVVAPGNHSWSELDVKMALKSGGTKQQQVHDYLHYLANYLDPKTDTLRIWYGYDLCLCPKWHIASTSEPIWVAFI